MRYTTTVQVRNMKVGDKNVNPLYVGSKQIKEAYVGGVMVYGNTTAYEDRDLVLVINMFDLGKIKQGDAAETAVYEMGANLSNRNPGNLNRSLDLNGYYDAHPDEMPYANNISIKLTIKYTDGSTETRNLTHSMWNSTTNRPQSNIIPARITLNNRILGTTSITCTISNCYYVFYRLNSTSSNNVAGKSSCATFPNVENDTIVVNIAIGVESYLRN